MNASLSASNWIACIRQEYLAAFIRDGGAAVKFAVALDPSSRDQLTSGLESEAKAAGHLFVTVRSEDTRIHLIDQILFRIADQIDWILLARRVISDVALKAGYQVPSQDGAGPWFEAIAHASGIDGKIVLMELRQRLTSGVFKRRSLSKDFRVAMFQLCMAILTGEPVGSADALVDWLTGRNPSIAAVKPYFIFNRVGRANARHLLESLFRWVHLAGLHGVVVLIDIGRLAVARNPKDGQIYYTKAGVLDAFEVLRQFLDATDRLMGSLMVVMPSSSFVDEGDARGISAYAALKLRIFDEVHDRRLVNPMSGLVRVKDPGIAI